MTLLAFVSTVVTVGVAKMKRISYSKDIESSFSREYLNNAIGGVFVMADFNNLDLDKSPLFNAAYRMVESERRAREELCRIRKNNGLSQQDVADRIGTTQSAVSRIENFDPGLRLSTLRRYALACGGEIEFSAKGTKPEEAADSEDLFFTRPISFKARETAESGLVLK